MACLLYTSLDSHPYMDAFTEGLGGNAYGGTYIIDEAAAFYKKEDVYKRQVFSRCVATWIAREAPCAT